MAPDISTPDNDKHEVFSPYADTHAYTESLIISTPHEGMLKLNPASYSPQILTVGPLYHKEPDGSRSFDDYKAPCVERFLRRHGISDTDELLQHHNWDLRHMHYSSLPENISRFLKLLVAEDTIFIHEFLLFLWTEIQRNDDTRDHFPTLCNNDLIYSQVWRDLFLMGNQIPMSSLVNLIEKFPNPPNLERNEIQDVLADVVKRIDPFPISSSQHEKFETPNFLHCNHLLDFLYVWVKRKPAKEHSKQAINPQQPDPKATNHQSASQLSKAGTRFIVIQGSISEMKHDKRKRRFYLPGLVVQDNTEDVLTNLLAYEESLSNTGHEFSLYVVTMNSLIKTQEDLAILTRAQVIQSKLGSSERLLQMWSAMASNVEIGSRPR